MALTHQITDGTNTITFIDASGHYLIEDYRPKISGIPGDNSIPPDITEVLPTRLTVSSGDNAAVQLQKFHLLQKKAAEYAIDETQVTPVWYHQTMTDETGARRALVRSLEYDPDFNWMDSIPGVTSGINRGAIILVRHPYWERTTSVAMSAASPGAAASVAYDYTNVADIVGDVGARIGRFSIDVAATSDPIDRVWMGVRSDNKHGDAANLGLVWECEDGVNGTYVSDQAVGTASGGNVSRCANNVAFDNTWVRAVYITVAQAVGANYVDQYGRFLWLLRAMVSAGTWEVKARFGTFTTDATVEEISSELVEVDSTSFDIYELGVADMPIRNLQVHTPTAFSSPFDIFSCVHLYAQRTSGTGTLDLDCLMPIPVDEGFCYLKTTDLDGTRHTVEIGCSPKDEFEAMQTTSTQIYRSVGVAPTTFYLPPGDGRIICAYARSATSDITDAIRFNNATAGQFFPRWVSLRGAE